MKPGLIGVIAQDAARFSTFAASLTALTVPPGSAIKWVMGHSIAASRNELVRDLLSLDGADWLFLLDDDHAFDSDLLVSLLEVDVDIVVPLCLTRAPPYQPVVFTGWHDDEHVLRDRLDLNDHPDGGILPIHSGGTAGIVIRRRVLEALEEPWFEVGKAVSTEIGEDVYFHDKAREAGFQAWCDLDTPLGHATVATIWPINSEEEGWTAAVTLPGMQGGLVIPSDQVIMMGE